MSGGGAKPGERRGGRKAGTPNALTATVKAAILAAFDKAGGEDYLLQIAKDDPRTFCALLAKVLPTQIEPGDDGPVHMTFTWLSSPDDAKDAGGDADDADRVH